MKNAEQEKVRVGQTNPWGGRGGGNHPPMKTVCSLIYFDLVFPIQSLEFTKSLNFENVLIKLQNNLNFFFHLKVDFIDTKYF